MAVTVTSTTPFATAVTVSTPPEISTEADPASDTAAKNSSSSPSGSLK